MSSFLPSLPHGDRIKKAVQVKFAGYDHNRGAADGTLWDMENLTGEEYPLLRARAPRQLAAQVSQPWALYAHDGLYWVDGTGFYANGKRVGTVTAGEKSMCSLQQYVLIFPDKAYYRTDTGAFGSLEGSWSGTATFGDGTYAGEAAAANSISTTGAAFPFSVGDGVTISGCAVAENNKTAVIEEISADGKTLRFLENCFAEDSWTGTVQIKREVPDLDFVCENENRVWGCKGDRICGSALGNPFVWNNFNTVSTASFAVDVGSAGDFTGCAAYLGYAMFFKPDRVYKLYGDKPSNYQLMASGDSLGVAAGSGRSLAVAGGVLFYLSDSGVVEYTGGFPERISQAFGTVHYRNGVGGSDGRRYFISMQDDAGAWSLFAYDTQTGLWHREDASHAAGFAWEDRRLHLLSSTGLWTCGEGNETVESYAEFGDFTEDSPNKKGISRLQLRLELESGAQVTVKLRFDGGDWQTVKTLTGSSKRSFVLPIIPRRCDHWRIRLEGVGQWALYSLSREFYEGSDLQ